MSARNVQPKGIWGKNGGDSCLEMSGIADDALFRQTQTPRKATGAMRRRWFRPGLSGCIFASYCNKIVRSAFLLLFYWVGGVSVGILFDFFGKK